MTTVITMKIAYAGFDLMYPALEALGESNEVLKLFTCAVDGDFETNERVIAFAKSRGIPCTTDRITAGDIEELLQKGCDLLVSAGYYYRIPIDSRLRMVNIHPSLLPYGRGAWPMPLAILDDLPESGVTVHKTAEDFDTGDILLQERFRLAPDENLDSFMEKVNARVPAMMRRLTAELVTLWNDAKPQDAGVYQDEPQPEDYPLTKESEPAYADRVLRAFWGFYAVYIGGKQTVRIRRGRVVSPQNGTKGLPIRCGIIEVLQEY